RMLVVAKAGHEADVKAILEKWELQAATIGVVTDDGLYRVREGDAVVCEVPGYPLVTGCPTYVREAREADEPRRLREWDPMSLEQAGGPADPTQVLLRLLGSPNLADKSWIYRQYDSTVRTNTVEGPGGDAGVLRLRGTTKGIAATLDCNGRYCYLNPRRGGMQAVAEAARNLACVGARPRAVTDNLNFGNPLKPEVYYQLSEAVEGIAEACRRLDTPVTGGNVSLYNENPRGAIHPTPVIGMVGVLEDVTRRLTMGFRDPGDAIVLLGRNTAELGGSEYVKVVHGRVGGDAPAVDLEAERSLIECLLELAGARLLRSAHDCSEGGLAICLAESALANNLRPLGVEVALEDDLPGAPLLFGEAQGRALVSCAPASVEAVLEVARRHGVPAARIGVVGEAGGGFTVRTRSCPPIEAGVSELREAWATAIPRMMERSPAAVEVEVEHPAPSAGG
ncbi:MAG TPA: AIR synthase-related protein, partial [Longimicrobiales bacterium]